MYQIKKILVMLICLIALTGCEASEEVKAERLAKQQDDTAIVLAQWALEEVGIEDYYNYTKDWNVARQKLSDTTAWIVTFRDKKYGRIKYIAHWDGNVDELRYKDIYLLVSGTEIYNYLD